MKTPITLQSVVLFIMAVLSPLTSVPAFGLDPIDIKGNIDAVTVYRGQAMVTRLIEVPGPDGLREVVIGDLPENILPGSLFAECVRGGDVRSVRYRVRPVAEDVREEVRAIDEQLRAIEDQLRSLAGRKQLLAEQRTYMGNLEQFAASTASAELSHGVLNADTLKTLTLFMFERREALTKDEHQLALSHRDLEERRDVLQRQRQVVAGASTRTAREAVVFLNITDPKGATTHLHYLVEGASWSPSYNIRAAADRDRVEVEYHASIRQMSGEDWSNVAMTLSTATPSLTATAPALAPLTLSLVAFEGNVPSAAAAGPRRDELQRLKKETEHMRNQQQQPQPGGGKSARAAEPQKDYDERLNALACDEQVLELITRQKAMPFGDDRRARQEGLSVTYQLPARTTLPSRADQQLVQVARLTLRGDFYRLATPVLTSYVYEEANIVNSSDLVLLAGPASTYVDGQFVGHGDVPTVTKGERFTVGLGIDSSLRAARELIDRSESVQGGNRSVEFTYRISLENFGDTPKAIRLLDRLPTGKEQEIRCSLISSEVPESTDATHAQTDRKKGIVRWDIEVPARTTGLEARGVTYKFKLEHDKGMTVTGIPAVASAQP